MSIFIKYINESNKIESVLRKKFPEVRLVMKEYDNYTVIEVMLIQEKRRGKGEAKAFMIELIKLSNEHKKDIYLSASDVYGGDLNKLNKFYAGLGFAKNTSNITKEKLVKHFE